MARRYQGTVHTTQLFSLAPCFLSRVSDGRSRTHIHNFLCVSPDVRFIYALISSPGSNSLGKRAEDGQTKPPDSLVLVGNSVDSLRLPLKPRAHHSIHGNQPPHDTSCASLNSEMRFRFRVIQSCGCFPFIVKLIGLCVFSLAISASCVMGADAWHMHLYNQCSFSGLPCLMV